MSIVVNAFDPSSLEPEVGRSCKVKVRPVYIKISRPLRTTVRSF